MLTMAATLKQQQRNVVDYVTQVCEAALWSEPAPTLLLPTQVSRKTCAQGA